jgi:DnaJ-class molecular chaperone
MSKKANLPAGAAEKPGDEVPPGSPQSGENICPRCNGSGRLADAQCPECGGSGKVTVLVGDA